MPCIVIINDETVSRSSQKQSSIFAELFRKPILTLSDVVCYKYMKEKSNNNFRREAVGVRDTQLLILFISNIFPLLHSTPLCSQMYIWLIY